MTRVRHSQALTTRLGCKQLRNCALVLEGATMPQFALRWILMFPEVSSAIAGAKNPQQIKDNVQTTTLPPLGDETMRRVREVYDKYIRAQVQNRW